MKTKLGISVGLIGALVYFAAIFGGYIPVLLVAGYILICEENAWLKKSAMRAVALMIAFSFLGTLIGFIPEILSLISTLVSIFEGTFYYNVVNSVIYLITGIIDILETILFLVLAVMALNQKTFAIPVVDDLIEKYASKTQVTPKFCVSCGYKLKEEDKVCSQCGTRVANMAGAAVRNDN